MRKFRNRSALFWLAVLGLVIALAIVVGLLLAPSCAELVEHGSGGYCWGERR